MFHSFNVKEWISWPLLRAHLCTLAVAVSFNSTWRAPRDAFRYGGLQFGLAYTVAIATVALPVMLLQLAVGQLSQQDAVGVWRAVPFFKGVGYMRLLVSFMGSVYSLLYVALTISYFIYTVSHSIPFWDCNEMLFTEDNYGTTGNASTCLNETFMAPVASKPEYYLAVALIVIFLWVILPFVFYNPVKLMKRLFYVLGPAVLLLILVTGSCIGDGGSLSLMVNRSDWSSFLMPDVWHSAITQALLSSQVAGGYLISAGDSIYANTNVQWTTLAFVGTNIVSTWGGLLFWYAVAAPDKDASSFAVLLNAYQLGIDQDVAWPLAIFTTLIISGFISVLVFLYPVIDRCRRMGGIKWRAVSAGGCVVGCGATLAVLAGRQPAVTLLEDGAVPLLISVATVLEILAFVFVYGWKVLVEDVEFLTSRSLNKGWVLGWCAAPGIIAPFTVWWVMVAVGRMDWTQPPWITITLTATGLLAFLVFVVFAAVAVARQVQYDCIGKLKSSFQPSRHWGPRDPITHYYWLARRDETDRGNLQRTRYYRRELGQMSGRPTFLNINTITEEEGRSNNDKKRSNSDDWLYTIYRRKIIRLQDNIDITRQRAKSLDWTYPNKTVKGFDSKEIDISSLNKTVVINENKNTMLL